MIYLATLNVLEESGTVCCGVGLRGGVISHESVVSTAVWLHMLGMEYAQKRGGRTGRKPLQEQRSQTAPICPHTAKGQC